MINRVVLRYKLKTYSCNIKKNKECNKRNCLCNNGFCERTIDFKYAKRTPLNCIKRIINFIIESLYV